MYDRIRNTEIDHFGSLLSCGALMSVANVVLVLSIAVLVLVLVLDSILRYPGGSLDQSSQHRQRIEYPQLSH